MEGNFVGGLWSELESTPVCGWLEALGKLPEGVCPRSRGNDGPYSYLLYLEIASRQNIGKTRPGQGGDASFS